MSANEPRFTPETLSSDGEIFTAPWQAQVFAMAVQFSESGLYTWKEWADVFSAEIAEQEKKGYEPSRDYYHCWVRALEKILGAKGHISAEEMTVSCDDTLANWPHPEHVAAREPIATDPARE